MRAPFQVLIIPYKIINKNILYGVFLRNKPKVWQFVSGGGEDAELPIEAAVRELREETSISVDKERLMRLDTLSSIPVVNITGEFTWGKDIFIVPEHTFAVNVDGYTITISDEHQEVAWLEYDKAKELLKYDSNKTALWELNEKLKRKI